MLVSLQKNEGIHNFSDKKCEKEESTVDLVVSKSSGPDLLSYTIENIIQYKINSISQYHSRYST